MRREYVAALIGLIVAIPTSSHAQDAVAEFYRGKQVSIIVGTGPGGSASLYAQALSHHMGRFMPGNPGFIVQHMPGAGGIVAATMPISPCRATARLSSPRAAPCRSSLCSATAARNSTR